MNYAKHNLGDTIVALATPQGSGALGIIRLSGADAIAIADIMFYGKKLAIAKSHTLHFGTIKRDEQVIDEVVVSLFKGPRSYTGEDVVEISCHGSDYILQKVIELAIEKGARSAMPGEFTLRAFLNGKMDLSQAEAVADLIASDNEAAHTLAIRQMRSGFSTEIHRLREELINFASLIELELDFSEEDVEFANREELQALVLRIQNILLSLINSFKLGNVIKNGVNTVIAGRPNAGKSTLLNALLNEERAIVSEIAGTTRDTIEEVLNINGIAFRLIDTAGIRQAHDRIEAIGVEKTFEKIRQSAIVVYIFDIAELSPEEVKADLKNLDAGTVPLLVLANKTDKHETSIEAYRQLTGMNLLAVSAKKQSGLDELKTTLYEMVTGNRLLGEGAVVSNTRHLHALHLAKQNLGRVLSGMDQQISGDLLAMDIREAIHQLGHITGEVTTDDLLGNIFSNFCIGK